MVGIRSFPFGARPIFRGYVGYVSFREGNQNFSQPELETRVIIFGVPCVTIIFLLQ